MPPISDLDESVAAPAADPGTDDEAPTPGLDSPHVRGIHRFSAAVVAASTRRPKRVLFGALAITLVLLAAFVRVEVDTDPENMLPADAPARVINAELRETFGGAETIVVGLFSPTGTIDATVLASVADLHDRLASADGVDERLLVSARTAIGDSSTAAADIDADVLLDRISVDPLLGGNVVSSDGDALAVFVPLDDKSDAQPIAELAEELVEADPAIADWERHVAGLPLAQEAFGDQMFVQMAVFAPLAGLAIFLLMLFFFKRLVLVGPAMVLALLTVIWTMGLLIGSGNTVHIMSSMIPIFLMPIAILDAIHVISEFFDRISGHPEARKRRGAVLMEVFGELSGPIAYTTATTAVGFAALALTPIPPVRVFGIFVAIGVVIAWLGTLTVLPAMLMVAPERALDKVASGHDAEDGRFARFVRALPTGAARRRVPILATTIVLAVAAVPAIASLQVNDNPVNWFRSGHEVRVATERLNDALPGTFTANILLTESSDGALLEADTIAAVERIQGDLRALDVVGASVAYPDLLGGATDAQAAEVLTATLEAQPLAGSLITEDLTQANVRIQLRSGDNQAMQLVLDEADASIDALPEDVTARWAGESPLNLVWQDEMVSGMISGFAVTLVVVLGLLVLLFRSIRWAVLALAPVLWTIAVVYAALAVIGKDIDMPVAVLSTMVLGIGVDFAIHFVERFREALADGYDTHGAVAHFAAEPARALTRNAAVIAIGFTPLLFSSLTPYVIVGLLLASIIVLSWFVTLVVLPAAVTRAPR